MSTFPGNVICCELFVISKLFALDSISQRDFLAISFWQPLFEFFYLLRRIFLKNFL